MVHVFIDLIRIVSIKGLTCHILPHIFRVLLALLTNRRTESIVLAALNISEPCFTFASNPNDVPEEVWASMGRLLEHIVDCNYISDLMICSTRDDNKETIMELFYPFRYNNTEY